MSEEMHEQALAGREFARLARSQFESFIAEGFTEEQAMRLMDPWTRAMMHDA